MHTAIVHSFPVLSLPAVTALEEAKVYVTVCDSTENMRNPPNMVRRLFHLLSHDFGIGNQPIYCDVK